MEQTELDWQRTHARRGDPGTSRKAARSSHGAALKHCETIYWCLMTDRTGGLTYEEIAQRTGLDRVQVGRRLSDLERQGRAETTGEKRQTSSGCPARVWRVRGIE